MSAAVLQSKIYFRGIAEASSRYSRRGKVLELSVSTLMQTFIQLESPNSKRAKLHCLLSHGFLRYGRPQLLW